MVWNLDKSWSHDNSVWTEAQVFLDTGEKVKKKPKKLGSRAWSRVMILIYYE